MIFICIFLSYPLTKYTIIGMANENNKIVPYRSKKNIEVLLISSGELTIDELFLREYRTQRITTWAFRFLGWVFIFSGISCTSKIFHIICKRTSLASIDLSFLYIIFTLYLIVNRIPLMSFLAPDLQNPTGGNMLLAVSITLIIASYAWIFHRPMIGAGLLFAAISPSLWLAQALLISN